MAELAEIRRTDGVFGRGVRGRRPVFSRPEARICSIFSKDSLKKSGDVSVAVTLTRGSLTISKSPP
jgi:hypothetical protein